MSRFSNVPFDAQSQEKASRIVALAKSLELELQLVKGGGRAKALALTKLEECVMWSNKAIRDDQIDRMTEEDGEQ
jgi:hypothetical protein